MTEQKTLLIMLGLVGAFLLGFFSGHVVTGR